MQQFVDGIENAPRAFIGMLQGKNLGKQLVKVSGL
jgi:NADPH-dependent curcumin reductase CurA